MDQVIQWNCRSIISKKSDLIYLLNKYSPFLFAVQETWLKPISIFKINGYHVIREDRPDGYGGVAFLVKNSIPFSQINLPTHDDDYSIVAVSIKNICFVSLYIPHPSSSILSEIKKLFSTLPRPFLVLGDFNSQHQSWGSSVSTSLGDSLLDIIDLSNLCILNNGKPTRRTDPNQNISAVDLSISTPNLAASLSWCALPSTHGSDHYPIVISFPFSKPKHSGKLSTRKYRLPDRTSSDWIKFKNSVDSKVSSLPDISPGNENVCADKLASILNEAAKEVFPQKDNSFTKIPSPPWWDKDCTVIIKKRKELEQIYNNNMTDLNYANLSKIMIDTKKLFKQKKFQSWRSFCNSISPDTPATFVWRNVNRFKSAYNTSQMSIMAPALVNDFANKLAPSWVPTQRLDNNHYQCPLAPNHNLLSLNSPFSFHELESVIHNTKDSAPGKDGLPYIFFANISDNLLSYYLKLINTIMITGVIPLSWKSQVVLPIRKPNKSPSDASSFRPIVLSSVLIKLAELLIKNRLEWYVESKDLLSKSQFGFRKGKSTTDNLSILTTDIRLAFTSNKSVVAAFLDINSAYDNVLLSVLRSKLEALNVPIILLNFIMNILYERHLTLPLSNESEVRRTVWRGLPQGSVLSPLLYNIYTYDLDSALGNNVKLLQYADDLLLYSTSSCIDFASSNISSALVSLKSWMDANGLDLSATKSTIVIFTRKRSPLTTNIYYNNTMIPLASQFKFLGIVLDSKLTGKAHCDYVVNKCERLLNLLRCLAGVWWGAHPQSLKLVYNALIRSVLDYGTFLLEPGNVAALKKLDNIQKKALRIITGAMKSSPINALQIESCEPPLHLRRQFLADRFLFRSLQFANHPLFHLLQSLKVQINSSSYWHHKSHPCLIISYSKYINLHSPIHRANYLPLFNVDYDALQLSPLVTYNLIEKDDISPISTFKLIIDAKFKDHNHIFSDASKSAPNECVGVGVFHSQLSIVQKVKLPPETSVFTGECVGLFKAIEYIILMKLKKTVIFSDAMSALQALCKFPFRMKSYFPIIFDIRNSLVKCGSLGYSVEFVWIPSHCGITGNEISDRLAKEAVHCGDMYPYKTYSHDLLSLPAVFLSDEWQSYWNNSRLLKGMFYSLIQPNISHKTWFRKAKLGKTVTSILIRMRLGHVCSPAHLAKLKIVNEPTCECGVDIGDVNHIFFSCVLHDRSSFLDDLLSLGVPFPLSILSLLCTNDLSIYKCIASFINLNNIKI